MSSLILLAQGCVSKNLCRGNDQKLLLSHFIWIMGLYSLRLHTDLLRDTPATHPRHIWYSAIVLSSLLQAGLCHLKHWWSKRTNYFERSDFFENWYEKLAFAYIRVSAVLIAILNTCKCYFIID